MDESLGEEATSQEGNRDSERNVSEEVSDTPSLREGEVKEHRGIDHALEENADKLNLTAINVKSILHVSFHMLYIRSLQIILSHCHGNLLLCTLCLHVLCVIVPRIYKHICTWTLEKPVGTILSLPQSTSTSTCLIGWTVVKCVFCMLSSANLQRYSTQWSFTVLYMPCDNGKRTYNIW